MSGGYRNYDSTKECRVKDMAELPILPTLSTQQAAELVSTVLGARIGSASLGIKNANRLKAWSNGEDVKSLAMNQRLLALATVVQILKSVEMPDNIVRSWVLSPNPLIGERTALDCVSTGDTIPVVRAARTFAAR
jgi:hypothetical protein